MDLSNKDILLKYIRSLAEAREYGVIEGHHEGRVEIILKILAGRFGALPETVRTRIHGAPYVQLNELADRILTAGTLEEVLDRV